MTREEARKILEDGGSITVLHLTFYAHMMSCEVGCCDDGFKSIDEALDTMNIYEAFDDN
jgi:hypothetical protein